MQKTYQILTCALCNSPNISIKNKESESTSIIKCDECNNETFISYFNMMPIELDSNVVDLLSNGHLILPKEISLSAIKIANLNLEFLGIVNEKCLCTIHNRAPNVHGKLVSGFSVIRVEFCCDGSSKRKFITNMVPFIKKNKSDFTVDFMYSIKL